MTTTEAVVIKESEVTSTTTSTTVEEATVEATAISVERAVEETAIKVSSLNSLKYLVGEIYSHSYLLNKATGAEIFIDEGLKSDLAEAITLEEGLTLLREVKGMELMKGFEVRDNSLCITAFKDLSDSKMQKAVRTLLALLVKSVIAKAVKDKNVNLHKIEIKRPENEKFAFRTWLLRLGWKGGEGKAERSLLYKNLAGNTAFCTEDSKTRWKAKHKKASAVSAESTESSEASESTESSVEEVEGEAE